MKRLPLLLLLFAALPLLAQKPDEKQNANSASLTINLQPLGDSDAGVVNRVTFRYTLPEDVPPEAIALQGSILQGGAVVKNFRFMLSPTQNESESTLITVPPGETEIEGRLDLRLPHRKSTSLDSSQ